MPFLQRILGEKLGIRYLDTFRKRYYNAELYFSNKLRVKSLDYDTVLLRYNKLNGSNFSSELWFINYLNKVSLNIDCKRNFPILNRFFGDFYFPGIGLVIEIDGKSHDKSKEYDKKRDSLFEKRNLRVIRIKHGDSKLAKEVIEEIVNLHKIRTSIKPKIKLSRKEHKRMEDIKRSNFNKKKAKHWYLRNKKIQENMNKMMLDALKK